MSGRPTPVVDIVAPARRGTGSRRQAWLRAGCVFLVVLIYLCWWTTYAVNGLTVYGRYRQLEPGVPASAMGAEFRLTSLVQTDELTNQITDEILPPMPNSVWVVARVEVVRQVESDFFLCSFSLLGPDRRVWEKDSGFVSRDISCLLRRGVRAPRPADPGRDGLPDPDTLRRPAGRGGGQRRERRAMHDR